MCGITGFYDPLQDCPEGQGRSTLGKMVKTLGHRGPDANGTWCNHKAGIYLGHTRLSILDLSEAGAQPMKSHCGRFVMSYNGEIYNADELSKALPEITFRGHSDTEILLEGFTRLGIEKTLAIIKGMFAIALWDEKEQKLHLIRDHFGKKPLYLGIVEGKLVFASELKAIKVLTSQMPEISEDAFRHYRYFGFIPAPYSIYKNIVKLKPAHMVSFSKEALASLSVDKIISRMEPYWHLQSADKSNDALGHVKETLARAVKQRMVSDVPLGAFLSGGIDSSLITALMQSQSNTPVKTFSIGFTNGAFDESRHAEKIANHLKTDHTTYMVTPQESLNIIPDLPRIYDEPFADYSQIPTAILCQQAKKGTTVALSGDGGDEVFCGYKRYFMLQKLLKTTQHIPAPLRNIMALMLTIPSQKIYNGAKVNGKRIHSIAGFLKEKTLDDTILRTLSIDPDFPMPEMPEISESFESNFERMMMIDTTLYLPDDILVKVDRASMHSSLEVRSPLLDKDVVELAWQIPIQDKIVSDQNRGKRPLYDLLCEYVPHDLIDRPKQGFTPPIASWLRGELKDWAKDLLETDTPLYGTREKQIMWQDFQSGKKDNHPALWSVLMAQSWYMSVK